MINKRREREEKSELARDKKSFSSVLFPLAYQSCKLLNNCAKGTIVIVYLTHNST